MAHDMTQNMANIAQEIADIAQSIEDMAQTMTSKKVMKPPVSILNLPPELLDLILSFSASSAWAGLRLTCRHLYTHTLDTFARRFFHEVKTDLSETDLVRLECLAKNAIFAPYVHSLQIKHSQASSTGPLGICDRLGKCAAYINWLCICQSPTTETRFRRLRHQATKPGP